MAHRNPFCLGLDPDLDKIPKHLKSGDTTNPDVALHFCTSMVDATQAASPGWYKPNLGFFLRLGGRGLDNLCLLVEHVRKASPHAGIILDAKSCDIGNSMTQYVAMAFDLVGADGMTANAYPGQDACQPLLDRKDKLAIFLCKTSNKDSGEFQNLRVLLDDPEEQAFLADAGHMSYPGGGKQGAVDLYRHVAYRVSKHWNEHGNCGLVVGATYPNEVHFVRQIIGDQVTILAPGIGKQGGDLEATLRQGVNTQGERLIVNVGSDILYASSGVDCFEAAATRAMHYRGQFDRFATA